MMPFYSSYDVLIFANFSLYLVCILPYLTLSKSSNFFFSSYLTIYCNSPFLFSRFLAYFLSTFLPLVCSLLLKSIVLVLLPLPKNMQPVLQELVSLCYLLISRLLCLLLLPVPENEALIPCLDSFILELRESFLYSDLSAVM